MAASSSTDAEAPRLDPSFWRLPELLREVRKYTSQADFAALCLTSRTIHHAANKYLYETIDLDLEGRVGSVLFSSLYDTMGRDTELARNVKSLFIRFGHYHNIVQPTDTLGDESSHLTILSGIVRRLPNLQILRVVDYYSSSIPQTQDLEDSLSLAHSLKHFEFNLNPELWPDYDPGRDNVNTAILSRAFEVPSLESITLTLQEGIASPGAWLNLPTNNHITKLSFNWAYIGMETLKKILAYVPQLRELDLGLVMYADTEYSHVGHYVDCKELWEALSPCASSLEYLRVAIDFTARTAVDVSSGLGGGASDSVWGVRDTLDSLRSCTRLKSLEIALEMLLGWDESRVIELEDVLPDSIESLHTRCDFATWMSSPWDYPEVAEKLQNYLAVSRTVRLKDLTVGYYDHHSDELEPFDVVKDRCESLGVQFSLDEVMY